MLGSIDYFRNGELHKGLGYHADGTLSCTRYYKDGKIHGKTVRYYRNGHKKELSTWKNGERHGTTTCWDKEGNVTQIQHYENDKLIHTEMPTNVTHGR